MLDGLTHEQQMLQERLQQRVLQRALPLMQ